MVALPMTFSASELPQITPFSAFCTAIHSFVTDEPRDFKLGTLIYHSKFHPADEKSSLKGAWIYGFVTGEPRDFKLGTLIYHSKSHPADEKSSLKGAWSGSGDPF